MALFKRLKAPEAQFELKLNEVAYGPRDRFTGRMVLETREELSISEFRLEFRGTKTTKQAGSSTGEFLPAHKLLVGGPVRLAPGQHYEVPFEVDLPGWTREGPYTEFKVKVTGVAAVDGRPDLAQDAKPAIAFPYVLSCGNCEFVSQPLPELIRNCPKCGYSFEAEWS